MAAPHSDDIADKTAALFASTAERALAYLRAGVHVHITGPRFSGRTILLREVGRRLIEDGRSVLYVSGNPAWRDEPFGALVTTGLLKEPNPRLLSDAIVALERSVAQRQSIVLCDDADDIDSRTAGVLISVLRHSRVLSVTVGQGPSRDSGLLSANLTPAATLEMATLDLNQLHELASMTLGAPLEPTGVSKLTFESGGLYGLARAILVIGRETGNLLLRADGQYHIPGSLWSPALRWLAERLLDGVDADGVAAAMRLAQRGPLPTERAVALVGSNALTSLLMAGIAYRTEFNKGATVGVYPGLLIDYLKQEPQVYRLTDEREAGIVIDLAAELENQDTGLIAQQLIQKAATDVHSLYSEWTASPTPRLGLRLVVSLLGSTVTNEEIEHIVSHTDLTSGFTDISEPSLFLTVVANWLAAHGREDEAFARLRDFRASHPSSDAMLRASEAQLLLIRDHQIPPELLQPAGPDDHPFGEDMLTDVRIQLAIAQGKSDAANALLQTFEPSLRYLTDHKSVLQLLNNTLTGQPTTSAAEALKSLRSNRGLLPLDIIDGYGYAALIALCTAGRSREAASVLRNILATSLQPVFRNAFHNAAFTLGALIAAQEGREAAARSLSAQSDALSSAPGPFPGMEPRGVHYLIEWAFDHADHTDDMWRSVADGLQSGCLARALYIAVEAIEMGPDRHDVLPLLGKAIDTIESPLLTTMGRYVIAVAGGDASTIESCIAEFNRLDATLYSTKAAVTLALLYRHQGRSREAFSLINDSWHRALTVGPVGAGLFSRLRDDIALSEREREITRHFANGMSHAEIASLLGLSVRTVETHLLNVARKIGASGRMQLTESIETWLDVTGV